MDGNASIWSSDNYNQESIRLCVEKLKEEFGQQFSNSQSILEQHTHTMTCLLYTSPSPRDGLLSRMPSSA